MKKLVSLLLVFVMLCLLLSSCTNVKDGIDAIKDMVDGNNKIAASSENFEITQSMMCYFTNSYYQHWYSQNYYYILLGYINFDVNKALNEQYTDSSQTQTYYDFFVEGTKNTVITYLNYCEFAFNEPTVNYEKLKAGAEKYAAEQMKVIKEAAKFQGCDYKSYIRNYFGDNVTEKALNDAWVIEKIASDCYDIVLDMFYNTVTEKDEDDYFEKNLSDFIKAECVVINVPDTDKENVQRLSEAKDMDEFNALMNEFGYSNAKNQTLYYDENTSLGKFLFGGVKEQYNIGEIAEEAKNAELYDSFVDDSRAGYLTLYFVTRPAYRDETPLRDVGHILFRVDSSGADNVYKTSETAKAAAERLFSEIMDKSADGFVSKEVFESMATNTYDTEVFYYNVNKGEMVYEFEKWLFEAEKAGQMGIIETTYGWHIIYYGGESGEISWRYHAHNSVVGENMNTWYDSLAYTITLDDSVLEKIFNP